MSLLFDLPRDLYNEVCSEWLKTIDMGKLDSAMCQSEYRESLLQQLQDKQMEYSLDKETRPYYNWIYARNIPMKTLNIDETLFANGKLLCRVRFHQVQTLKVADLPNVHFSLLKQVVGACINVTELNWNDSVHILNDCVSVKSLTSLTVCLSMYTFERYCHWIFYHCSMLHTLEIRDVLPGDGLVTDDLTRLNRAIKENSSTLRVLNLGTFDCFPFEVFNCPNLTDLTIYTYMEWSEIVLHINQLVTMNFTISSGFSRLEFNNSEACLIIENYFIPEHLLCEFLTNFNGLKAITIRDPTTYTDNLCYTIVDRFSATLIHISVYVLDFTNEALQYLFDSCERLESFQQSVITRDICNAIINARPNNLKALCMTTIGGCSVLMIELLTSVPSLMCLKLKYVNESQEFKQLIEFIETERQRGRDITLECGYY